MSSPYALNGAGRRLPMHVSGAQVEVSNDDYGRLTNSGVVQSVMEKFW